MTSKTETQITLSAEKQFIHGDAVNKGFVQLPRMIIKCKGLSAEAKAVYNCIASYVYEYGRSAFPSIHHIALETELTAKSVVKYIGELSDKGFIKKIRRGRGRTNDYYIMDAHEVGLLHVSEMLWAVLHDVKSGKRTWEEVHDAFLELSAHMKERKHSFAELDCTEEVREGIKSDLLQIMEGGSPTLMFIQKKPKVVAPTAQPSAPQRQVVIGGSKKPYHERTEDTWGVSDFVDYFYRKYLETTGNGHSGSLKVHQGIMGRILKQLDGNKFELRKVIDSFFDIGYDNKTVEWFGTSGRIGEIYLYINEGKKPFYVERKVATERKQKEVKEAKQENKGMGMDSIKKLLGED